MPSPHTKWPRPPQKQHSKKAPNPGSHFRLISKTIQPRPDASIRDCRSMTTSVQSAACRENGERKLMKKRGC